jgi:hypothetical protein
LSDGLIGTSEQVYPRGLGRIVEDLVRSDPPSTPLALTGS